jgi:hypothetical protein
MTEAHAFDYLKRQIHRRKELAEPLTSIPPERLFLHWDRTESNWRSPERLLFRKRIAPLLGIRIQWWRLFKVAYHRAFRCIILFGPY